MLLKRLYDKPADWEPERAPDGRLLNPLPVVGLSLHHTGTHKEQNFSRRLVEAGLAQGWVSMAKGQLILHTEDEDLTYTIVRPPGQYCCHCQADVGDDPSGQAGRDHVAQAHAGAASPDPANPAGFRMSHAYECVLEESQHARWNHQAVQAAKAAAPAVRRGEGKKGPATGGVVEDQPRQLVGE
jgi:hypothetical protein